MRQGENQQGRVVAGRTGREQECRLAQPPFGSEMELYGHYGYGRMVWWGSGTGAQWNRGRYHNVTLPQAQLKPLMALC